MPIDYSRYPPDWKERRERILERDERKCKFCGVPDRTTHPDTGSHVVLTIAHLDHDEENWSVEDERLAALCQRCHLQYDAPEKSRRRRSKKYNESLFPIKGESQ